MFPADMAGSTALDIGCNAGFYSLKLAERGALVTGIDNDARYLAQARFAASVLGVNLTLHRLFDYPMEERRIFEEPGFPAMYFVEHRYAGDPTNWWIPNEAAAAAMLRSAGFIIDDHPGPGLYVCRPGDHPMGRAGSPA